MADKRIEKIQTATAPRGQDGEVRLAAGKTVSLRMWKDEEPTSDKPASRHSYEVVGYAVSGKAELTIEGETVSLEPGDSWLVPAHAEHRYRIVERFTAIEATSPPAE